MRICYSVTVSLSDKSIVLQTALPDAFDLEETAGKRTAAAAPPSAARAHSSLKSPLEISRERSAETSAPRERFTASSAGGVAVAGASGASGVSEKIWAGLCGSRIVL